MKLVLVNSAPKGAKYFKELSLDGEIEEVMEWCRSNLKGTIWWSKTQFRSQTDSKFASYRKKNFSGGDWKYEFWFSHKADAALFILFWS